MSGLLAPCRRGLIGPHRVGDSNRASRGWFLSSLGLTAVTPVWDFFHISVFILRVSDSRAEFTTALLHFRLASVESWALQSTMSKDRVFVSSVIGASVISMLLLVLAVFWPG
jgi:hypothetical protein